MGTKNHALMPDDLLMKKIYIIRDQKVMLDRDLAELYGVETRRLKEQVRRNLDRFPEDFMFELTKEELQNWMSQFATSNRETLGIRKLPFAFTEQGIAMLSSVLNSQQAIQTNIRIMRIFTKTRKLLTENAEIIKFIQILEQKTDGNTKSIELLFEYMDQLMVEKEEKPKKRKLIGFKTKPGQA